MWFRDRLLSIPFQFILSDCENDNLLGIGSVSALMSVPARINRQISNIQQEHFDAINCRPGKFAKETFTSDDNICIEQIIPLPLPSQNK